MEPAGQQGHGIEAAHRTLTLVWGGMVAGLLLYAGVSYALLRTTWKPPVESASPAAFALITVGFALLIAAPFVGRLVDRPVPGGAGEGGGWQRAFGAYSASMIVSHALREGAGLLGVTTALVFGELLAGYALAAAALLMLVKYRPRREHLASFSRFTP